MSAGIRVMEYWSYRIAAIVSTAAIIGFTIPAAIESNECGCFSYLWIGTIVAGVLDILVVSKIVYDEGACCASDDHD